MMGSGGIDSQVSDRLTRFNNNPAALQQSYKQNPDLVTLLALQKVKSDMQAAAKDQALKLGQQPTVRQKLEQEVVGLTQQQVAQSLGVAGQQQQQRQQEAMSQMAQGARAPQPAGIQSLSPKKFSQGGIVKLADGKTVPMVDQTDDGPYSQQQLAQIDNKLRDGILRLIEMGMPIENVRRMFPGQGALVESLYQQSGMAAAEAGATEAQGIAAIAPQGSDQGPRGPNLPLGGAPPRDTRSQTEREMEALDYPTEIMPDRMEALYGPEPVAPRPQRKEWTGLTDGAMGTTAGRQRAAQLKEDQAAWDAERKANPERSTGELLYPDSPRIPVGGPGQSSQGEPFGVSRSDGNPTPTGNPFGVLRSDGNPTPAGVAAVADQAVGEQGGGGSVATSSPAMMAGLGTLNPDAEADKMAARYDERMREARDANALLVKEGAKRQQWMSEEYDPKRMARTALWASLAGLGTGGGRIGMDFANSIQSGQGSRAIQQQNRMRDQAGLESLMSGNRDFSRTDGKEGFEAEKGGYNTALSTNTDRDRVAADRERNAMLADDSKAWRYLQVYQTMMAEANQSEREAIMDMTSNFEALPTTQQLDAQIAKAAQKNETATVQRLELEREIAYRKYLDMNGLGDIRKRAEETRRAAGPVGAIGGIPMLSSPAAARPGNTPEYFRNLMP